MTDAQGYDYVLSWRHIQLHKNSADYVTKINAGGGTIEFPSLHSEEVCEDIDQLLGRQITRSQYEERKNASPNSFYPHGPTVRTRYCSPTTDVEKDLCERPRITIDGVVHYLSNHGVDVVLKLMQQMQGANARKKPVLPLPQVHPVFFAIKDLYPNFQSAKKGILDAFVVGEKAIMWLRVDQGPPKQETQLATIDSGAGEEMVQEIAGGVRNETDNAALALVTKEEGDAQTLALLSGAAAAGRNFSLTQVHGDHTTTNIESQSVTNNYVQGVPTQLFEMMLSKMTDIEKQGKKTEQAVAQNTAQGRETHQAVAEVGGKVEQVGAGVEKTMEAVTGKKPEVPAEIRQQYVAAAPSVRTNLAAQLTGTPVARGNAPAEYVSPLIGEQNQRQVMREYESPLIGNPEYPAIGIAEGTEAAPTVTVETVLSDEEDGVTEGAELAPTPRNENPASPATSGVSEEDQFQDALMDLDDSVPSPKQEGDEEPQDVRVTFNLDGMEQDAGAEEEQLLTPKSGTSSGAESGTSSGANSRSRRQTPSRFRRGVAAVRRGIGLFSPRLWVAGENPAPTSPGSSGIVSPGKGYASDAVSTPDKQEEPGLVAERSPGEGSNTDVLAVGTPDKHDGLADDSVVGIGAGDAKEENISGEEETPGKVLQESKKASPLRRLVRRLKKSLSPKRKDNIMCEQWVDGNLFVWGKLIPILPEKEQPCQRCSKWIKNNPNRTKNDGYCCSAHECLAKEILNNLPIQEEQA